MCVCCTAAGVWRVCVCEGMVVVMMVVVVLRGGRGSCVFPTGQPPAYGPVHPG